MPELLLELLSEEIPARLQARGAEDLARLVSEALAEAGLPVGGARTLHGPRRIALIARLPATTPATAREEKGPRLGAPEAALAGFARKHGLPEAALAAMRAASPAEAPVWSEGGTSLLARAEKGGGALLLRVEAAPRPAAAVLAERLPGAIRRLPWPRSMRWGTSSFTWVRPLRRILCLLDGTLVPFALAEGGDDAHGLVSGDETEGHPVHAPGPFAVRDAAHYEAGLLARRVVPAAPERERRIAEGVARLAAAEGLEVVPDPGLLSEVAGLVEWPVPLLGRVDEAFMDLPPEVMRTTMRVNQRYFALRHPDGRAAARFALVANLEPRDGGAAVVAGNERVLRARLADARFFWDADRARGLEPLLPALEGMVFHARLGTQAARAARLERLARRLAPDLGAEPDLAARAARLAKADLASGMVGEFPELQGVVGGHLARLSGEEPAVSDAISNHHRPLGPGDAAPTAPVSAALALADKLDALAGFFLAGERPSGSGDPYALRRAALGAIRILREGGFRLPLAPALSAALEPHAEALPGADPAPVVPELLAFLAERLRVQLRAEGLRHDVVAAAFGAGEEDDVNRLLARADALRELLGTPEGADLLAAHRRAANILRIEERRDGRRHEGVEEERLAAREERALHAALAEARPGAEAALAREDFAGASAALAALRAPVDAFFERVTVNDPDPALRANRLGLLAALRGAMDAVADFSRIEA